MAIEDTTPTTPPQEPAERTVDYDTYKRVVSAKQGLETQLHETRAKLAATSERAATADTLAATVDEWKNKYTEQVSAFDGYKAITAAAKTTDPDAVDAFRWQYGRLPEEGRPALADWIGTLAAEPDKAPKILQPFLSAPAAAPPQAPPKRPNAPAHPPTGQTTYSAEEMRKMGDEARRTGNWEPYKKARKNMGLTK